MRLKVLDVNYYLKFGREPRDPVICIFGNQEDGKSEMIRVLGFRPYIYGLPMDQEHADEEAQYIAEEFLLDVDMVERYKPMGFQEHKTQMFKIKYVNPKSTKELREKLINEGYVREVYEADILYKYRFMVDLKIRGFSTIEVPGNWCNYRNIKVIE
jgi:DNA polymerase, archaea type